eukprot:SAG31_NODE_6399_length_2034_cov_1.431525_3_plen_279_part_01
MPFSTSIGRRGQQFLSVLSVGLDLLDTKSKRGHFRSFAKDCRHPYVAAPSELAYLRRKRKILVFREYATRGSLRDIIHSANPVHPYNEKYVARGRPFAEKRLALLGRQILEGLRFLNSAGLRCVGLHCGNIVMLGDDHCAISEFEQTALGMRGRLTSWLIDKKEPEVFAFGQVLYEMATGGEAETAGMIEIPACPLTIQDALRLILHQPQPNPQPTTLLHLLALPVFAAIKLPVLHLRALHPGNDKTRKLRKRLKRSVGKSLHRHVSKLNHTADVVVRL